MYQSFEKVSRQSFEDSNNTSEKSDLMKNSIFLSRMAQMIQKLAKSKEVPIEDKNIGQQGQDQIHAIQLEETPDQEKEPQIVENPVQATQKFNSNQQQMIFEEDVESQDEEQNKAEEHPQWQQPPNGNTVVEFVEDDEPAISKRKPSKNNSRVQATAVKSIQKKVIPSRRLNGRIRSINRSRRLQRTLQSRSSSRLKSISQPPASIETPSKLRPRPTQQKQSAKQPVKQQKSLQKEAPSFPVQKSILKKKVIREEGRISIKIQLQQVPKCFLKLQKKAKSSLKIEDVKERKREIKASGVNKKVARKVLEPQYEQLQFRIKVPLSIMKLAKPIDKEQSTKPEQTALKSAIKIIPIQKAVPPISEPIQGASSNKKQFTPKILLSKSKQMQEELELKERLEQLAKKPKAIEKINLGSYTLSQLVTQVYRNKLISEEAYQRFSQSQSLVRTQEFLLKFQTGKLRKFNFQNIQFTPLDHRRLSQLLTNLYPERYSLETQQLPQNQSSQFIKSSYSLSPKEYFDIYSRIDKISDISWWSEIMVNQKARIHEAVTRGKEPTPVKNGVKRNFQKEDDIQTQRTDMGPKKRVKFV